jgi:hypothetical protein
VFQFTSLYLYLSTYYLSGCVQVLGHVHILFNENKCEVKSKEEGGDENLLKYGPKGKASSITYCILNPADT